MYHGIIFIGRNGFYTYYLVVWRKWMPNFRCLDFSDWNPMCKFVNFWWGKSCHSLTNWNVLCTATPPDGFSLHMSQFPGSFTRCFVTLSIHPSTYLPKYLLSTYCLYTIIIEVKGDSIKNIDRNHEFKTWCIWKDILLCVSYITLQHND